MMNAKEARQVALDVREAKIAKEKRVAEKWVEEVVSPAIEESANKGCYYTKVILPRRAVSAEMVRDIVYSYGYEVRLAKADELEIGW